MKLSRRGVFGAAAGALAAGPSVARNAFDGLQTVGGGTPYNLAGQDANCKLSDPKWEVEQIAKARRLAAGDIRDEDRNYPTEGPQCPYVALRSVSDAAKWTMRNARNERQWRERTIKSALDALDHYDKTGILRHFF